MKGRQERTATAFGTWAWMLGVLVAVLGLGCAGPRFDGAVYRGEGFAFKVPARPAGWSPLDATGTALAYATPHGGTVALGARCGSDGEDVPLEALTQHLFLRFTAREIALQELVPLDGREALHTELSAKLDGVQHRFDVWVLKKDGCVYDLYYLARPAAFAQDRDLFRAFVSGFGTLPSGG